MHMADQGTDNFDREFALSLVTNEQEVLYEIDEALHRIDGGVPDDRERLAVGHQGQDVGHPQPAQGVEILG